MTNAPDPVVADLAAELGNIQTVYTEMKSEDDIRAEAKAEESARVKKCQAVFGYGDASEATKALAFDGKSGEGDIALAILAETRAKGKAHLDDLAKSEAELAKANLDATPVVGTPDPKPAPATTPEGWKAEYEESDEIKADFLSADGYAAFMAAQAQGRVKILTGKDAR